MSRIDCHLSITIKYHLMEYMSYKTCYKLECQIVKELVEEARRKKWTKAEGLDRNSDRWLACGGWELGMLLLSVVMPKIIVIGGYMSAGLEGG